MVEVDGALALVLEYVRGPSLAELLRVRRPSLAQADLLARGILRGVAAAHRHGLIHRDLKPGNVLLAVSDDGLTPKITDFGLGKILAGDADRHRTRSGAAMGTPAYMAPEQIRDASTVDARADVFSLGAILYELVVGGLAFDAPDTMATFEAICAGHDPDLDEMAPGLPRRMRVAIEGALRVDPAQRFADGAALLANWTGEADGLEPEPLVSHPADAWSDDLLSVADGLAPSRSERPSDRPRPGSGATPTFEVSLGPLEATASAPTLADEVSAPPLDEQPVPWGTVATSAAVGALLSVPFSLGLLSTLFGSLRALESIGVWLWPMLAITTVGMGGYAAGSELLPRGRARWLPLWFAPPALVIACGYLGTGMGASMASQWAGSSPAPGVAATVAAEGTSVALHTELAALALTSLLLLAIAEVSAFTLRTRMVLDAPYLGGRRTAALVGALGVGTAMWLVAALDADGGPAPFITLLVLVGGSFACV